MGRRPRDGATPPRRRETTHELGARGEELAAAHLHASGHRILARNWRPRGVGLRGEIDLVALDGDALVIVEVKARRTGRFGGPLVAVTAAKQRQLRRLASAYLRDARVRPREVRFDVVAVHVRAEGHRIDHLRAAF